MQFVYSYLGYPTVMHFAISIISAPETEILFKSINNYVANESDESEFLY